MARWRGPVLVDTNVIVEAWRVDAWGALRGGYGLETVEECVIETQTGFQNRRPEQQIDREALLAGLKGVVLREVTGCRPPCNSATDERRRNAHL